MRPFVFARNANLGIRAAAGDVVLMNDDAQLLTPNGLTALRNACQKDPQLGVCSAAIQGIVGNPNQLAGGRDLRPELRTLAFICVYLPHRTLEQLGLLDERFVGYGFEDNDYRRRVLTAGLRLVVTEKCVVDHPGQLPSTFRTRPDLVELTNNNRQLFYGKHGDNRYGRRPRRSTLPRL